jgi:hypothetical protein
MSSGSGSSWACSGPGVCRGTATRDPASRSPSGRHPSSVRKGWLAVASTSRPEVSRTRNTSLTPLGNACVIVRGTKRSRSSSDQTGTLRAPEARRSLSVTSDPVSARNMRVPAVRQPDSRRSESMGFLSVRCSGPRFSWDRATTGTSSSLARSLRDRDRSETSCCRFSTRLGEDISCR